MPAKINKDEAIEELKKIMELIDADMFQGVLVCFNSKEEIGFAIAEKGFAEDRIAAVKSLLYSIYTEPNIDSRRWMVEKLAGIGEFLIGWHEAEGFMQVKREQKK